MEFTTRYNDEAITWQVELTWQTRRMLYRQEAVDGAIVDTVRLMDVLYPAAEAKQPRCIIGWDRAEDLSEAALWDIGLIHLQLLCIQVGTFIYTGTMPSDDTETEGEAEVPLLSEPPEPPTNSSLEGEPDTAAG